MPSNVFETVTRYRPQQIPGSAGYGSGGVSGRLIAASPSLSVLPLADGTSGPRHSSGWKVTVAPLSDLPSRVTVHASDINPILESFHD